jgi:hypothetical protein
MAYVRSEDAGGPWPHASQRKTMKWALKFGQPIVLTSGREIRSLMQVRDFMAELSALERQQDHWECTADLVFEAAHEHHSTALEIARRQLLLSLQRKGLV